MTQNLWWAAGYNIVAHAAHFRSARALGHRVESSGESGADVALRSRRRECPTALPGINKTLTI